MQNKKIKIGSTEYKLIYKDELEGFGHVDFDKCEIVINNGVCKSRIKSTTIHELAHVILFECGIRKFDDEHLTEALSFIINQLFKLKI